MSNGISLDENQRLNWLQLIRSENVGPATFKDLINHFCSAESALEALPSLIGKGGFAGKIRMATREQAERELDYARQNNAEFIGMGEPNYPFALRNIDYPPPLICVKGNREILTRQAIGIVGSRNASANGQRLTANFANKLGEAGLVIVSGLARGIDAAAHQNSLTSGTIAVFAGGVDQVFPDENRKLAQDIVDNHGALISEMPMGWKPRAKDFPRRNRLVAGISDGILVVEAAKRSGSLISARLANEAGRSVYAVPGSPLDPRSDGTNWLIRQGAQLVTKPKDILDDLQNTNKPSQIDFWKEPPGETLNSDGQPIMEADDVRQKIIEAIGPSPTEIDDVIRFSNALPGQVQLVILELDLCGKLERHEGNRISLVE